MTNLVIVESPAKAKTIEKYLGKKYRVVASFGHIRELPSKEGSVEPENNFLMHYQVGSRSNKYVSEIAKLAKEADKIILAPDPDREGESIAWHIIEVLKQKKAISEDSYNSALSTSSEDLSKESGVKKVKIERVVFNAITKNSIIEAIEKPRKIDMDLVNAQQARRALDYLVGFNLSPVLWRKLPGSRSAGRVQSVALRLICDREDEIQAFKNQEYWTIKVDLAKFPDAVDFNQKHYQLTANLYEYQQKKCDKFFVGNKQHADDIVASLNGKEYFIEQIQKKQSRRRAYAPFTTSSLQQEAARKLGFSASFTMSVAQKLYEGVEIEGSNQGLITYMRTDSIAITPEALEKIRILIKNNYGDRYLPAQANIFRNKVKNAQEAHEAIRPADFAMQPDKIERFLTKEQLALYELIWKRTIASQMSDVVFDQVVVDILTKPALAKFKANGSIIAFDGFYKIYREDLDEKDSSVADEQNSQLPQLNEGEFLELNKINPDQHFTEPPPRYSEASLVKKMEELGIGRPSTYANIISVLQDRSYVVLEKKRFIPQELGRIVTTFLKEFFAIYVAFDYTAELENQLDEISNGEVNWQEFLAKFWHNFKGNVEDVSSRSFSEVLESIGNKIVMQFLGCKEDGSINNDCDQCNKGHLNLKIGKFGAFLGCSNYPDCKNVRKIFQQNLSENSDEALQKSNFEPKTLGVDSATGYEIALKTGPFGPYLELIGSENINTNTKVVTASTKEKKPKAVVKKPKRVSLPKNLDINTITLEQAEKILSLPRDVGVHPETKEKIVANIGPYGPYLLHNKKFTSVKEDDILSIGLNRAVDLIHQDQINKSSSNKVAKKWSKSSASSAKGTKKTKKA